MRYILFLSVVIVGCATLPSVEKQTPAEIAARSKVSRDEFRKTTTIDGQKLILDDLGGTYYWLQCSKSDKDKDPTFRIMFKSMRGNIYGWAFWSEAFDENGERLELAKLGHEVGNGGITYELVSVELSREYLDKHKAIKIRIDGQRAKQVLILTENYIAGVMEKAKASGL